MLVAAALFAAAPRVAEPTTPAQYETEVWRAFKAQDIGEIRRLFAPEVGVYSEKTYGFPRAMQHLTIQQYKLDKMTSRTVGGGDLLLTYTMALRGLWDAKPVSERVVVGSLWHRDHGRWRCIEHAEIGQHSP